MLSVRGSMRMRALAGILLAALALGVAPTGATCAGPLSGTCHDRDPATDHDGREPQGCSAPR